MPERAAQTSYKLPERTDKAPADNADTNNASVNNAPAPKVGTKVGPANAGAKVVRSGSPARTQSAQTSNSAYANSSFAYSVLAQLNAERSHHGLPALRMNSQLVASAHAHNLAMARANQMSHQLPGEPYFTNRISAAGYHYRDAGENIGWNSEVSRSGVLELETMMYAEGAPPAGQVNHYSNIVNRYYTEVGIEVWIDPVHHKLWLTEDFGDR